MRKDGIKMTTQEIVEKLSQGFLSSEEALKLIKDNKNIQSYTETNILELLDEVRAGITSPEGFLDEIGESMN